MFVQHFIELSDAVYELHRVNSEKSATVLKTILSSLLRQ